jgi:hypothetical protein
MNPYKISSIRSFCFLAKALLAIWLDPLEVFDAAEFGHSDESQDVVKHRN